ncbi:SDR family oxidoreductase [Paenibacillus oryzisoli]|uniref:SDR family oxidoreductase n=1 Tax=Paenibacillus oryzisoli TaxID=1850517 RepID=UPI003D2870B0
MELSGKVCVVTGAARGIGLALSRQLVEAGAFVAMTDTDAAALAEAAGAFQPDCVLAVPLNVSSEASVIAAVEAVEARWGAISVWINNAGIARHRPIADSSESDIDHMLQVNAKGVMLGSKHALRHMRERRFGHIVNVSSTAGLRGIAGQAVYCASKFAVRGFTEALQQEAAPYGIRVTAVCPGGVDTAFWKAAREEQAPTELFLSPEQVASGILSVLKLDDACVVREIVLRSVQDVD